MTASMTSGTNDTRPPARAPRFEKPSPGSWTLDASHCERPLPRFVYDVIADGFSRGFREGLAAHGALLDCIEAAVVNGFIYTCVRPLGAPPEPKGPPPKVVFKLLTWLHPEVRRRVRRAGDSIARKLWRDEIRKYDEEWMPPVARRAAELRSADLAAMDDRALARRMVEAHALLIDATFVHHRINVARILPVGDLLAHVRAWTGASATEVLGALRGASPSSEHGLRELSLLADAIRSDGELVAKVRSAPDAEALIRELEGAGGRIGDATRAWIGRVGHLVTGFSPGYPTLRETPATLVESLRGALAGEARDDKRERARAAAEALAKRVPDEHRALFDELLEEARATYDVRDRSCVHTIGLFGIVRLAVLAAGRRLVDRGMLDDAEDALDLEVEELRVALESGEAPDREEVRRRVAWRRSTTAEQAPELLGPPPGAPPPPEWLPDGAARLHRAIGAYVEAMFTEAEPAGARNATVVRGVPASGGKRVGVARLVLAPGDFDRVRAGDVLVARITTPTYNMLLPLLAGIVTDRGGVLSHPAIVSREYGIPGVVGARDATKLIPDGAKVEIDGDAGTVRVLS